MVDDPPWKLQYTKNLYIKQYQTHLCLNEAEIQQAEFFFFAW